MAILALLGRCLGRSAAAAVAAPVPSSIPTPSPPVTTSAPIAPAPPVTADLILRLSPSAKNAKALAAAMTALAPRYGVDTPIRVAAFLAQTGHESGGFGTWVENLNYSADGLIATWPKRFTTVSAKQYAKHPEAIANKVYADRMGNGNEASGDGWRYRGRGLIQITGKESYAALAKAVGRKLDDLPAWLETAEGAVESALWFWKSRDLNRYADLWDIEILTRHINGGLIGIEDRRKWHARVADAMEITVPTKA